MQIYPMPSISSAWKFVIESRAFAMTGHYEDAIKSLDRLIPITKAILVMLTPSASILKHPKDIKGLAPARIFLQ